jgi:hypothetical protein
VRQSARRNPEPLIGATFSLAELVANHQPINFSDLIRNSDLHRVGAIPLIRWDAAG